MKELIDFKYKHIGIDNLYNNQHRHDNGYEVLYVHSGDGCIIIGDKAVSLISGAIYFINASDLHCSVAQNPKNYCRSLIVISSILANNLCNLLDANGLLNEFFESGGGVSVILDKEQEQAIEKIFMKINHVIETNDKYQKAVISSGFVDIMRACHGISKSVPPNKSFPIGKSIEYINSHLCENITLDNIAKHCYMSRYYLCHLFKNTFGMTIYDYILSRRLTRAQNMLISSCISVCEISEKCGFSSPSYFSMVFKKMTGVTPLQYRKNTHHQ